LPCDEGSKTRLMGEDGDVSLVCRFSTSTASRSNQGLVVQLTWSHAQYAGFSFVAE
jgi:hypothetical protein